VGTNATNNPILITLGLCILASILIAVIGFALRSRGKLRTQRSAMIWAVLSILPLFGAGAAMFTKHEVEHAAGITISGDNADDVRSAP
jgi:cbb3-type cytochrome oxidase subunit 3